MRVEWIKASVQCDACGRHFVQRVDPGRLIPEGWDLMDVIRDEIRGGALSACPSVQVGMVLCATCTTKADAIGDEDYQPTREEILRATAEE